MTAEPDVWPGATEEQMVLVEEAVRRLAGVAEVAGYWTPIGKVVEMLTHAMDPGVRELAIVAFAHGVAPTVPGRDQ